MLVGWRKVVASPKPVDIKEIIKITTLLERRSSRCGSQVCTPVAKEADGSLSHLVLKAIGIKTLHLNVWLNW